MIFLYWLLHGALPLREGEPTNNKTKLKTEAFLEMICE